MGKRLLFMNVALGATLLLVVGAAFLGQGRSPQPSGLVAYESDYSSTENVALWSSQKVQQSAGTAMLGTFGTEYETLNLRMIPAHSFARVQAQLVILGDWGGNRAKDSPDCLEISLNGGRRLLDSSLATPNPLDALRRQSFPDLFGVSEFTPQAGAADRNVKWAANGQSGHLDNAVYDIDFTFPHSSAFLSVIFRGRLDAVGAKDRAWGLGHVKVTLLKNPPPRLDPSAVYKLIDTLHSDDADSVVEAIRGLVSQGDDVLSLIQSAVARNAEQGAARAEALVEQLADQRPEASAKAQRGLLEWGSPVLPACHAALLKTNAPDVHSRIESVIRDLNSGSGTTWEPRVWRVLQMIGTPASLKLSRTLIDPIHQTDMGGLHRLQDKMNETEWKVLSAKITKVRALLDDPKISLTMAKRRATLNSSEEMNALQQLIDDPQIAADSALKRQITALRDAKLLKPLQGQEFKQLSEARNDLDQTAPYRMQALFITLGLLE